MGLFTFRGISHRRSTKHHSSGRKECQVTLFRDWDPNAICFLVRARLRLELVSLETHLYLPMSAEISQENTYVKLVIHVKITPRAELLLSTVSMYVLGYY